MNQRTHPEELPAEVLDDVASVVGAEVTLLSRLPGGFDVGAMRIQLAGRADAVLKAWPRARPNQLDEALRAQRVVEHMRRRGYPTPAWLWTVPASVDTVSSCPIRREFVDGFDTP